MLFKKNDSAYLSDIKSGWYNVLLASSVHYHSNFLPIYGYLNRTIFTVQALDRFEVVVLFWCRFFQPIFGCYSPNLSRLLMLLISSWFLTSSLVWQIRTTNTSKVYVLPFRISWNSAILLHTCLQCDHLCSHIWNRKSLSLLRPS
jgi:hypothetical protein